MEAATVDVVGVDVLDGCSTDISRLGPQSNAPELVHATQLLDKRKTSTEIKHCLIILLGVRVF